MELKFRDLFADEIELRVGSIIKTDKADGFTLLLYKNARVDMALLDEVVGVGNWQREHKILGNDIYCRVGIYNQELGQWIWREDAGAEANTEVEKSKASDSFKRACVNFGLGRCLYSAPFVFINNSSENTPKMRYFVKDIDYKDHKITKLVICNEKTHKVVYSFGSDEKVDVVSKPKTAEKGTIQDSEKALIKAFLESKNVDECTRFYQWLDKTFHTMNYEMLSAEEGIIVCKKLKLI